MKRTINSELTVSVHKFIEMLLSVVVGRLESINFTVSETPVIIPWPRGIFTRKIFGRIKISDGRVMGYRADFRMTEQNDKWIPHPEEKIWVYLKAIKEPREPKQDWCYIGQYNDTFNLIEVEQNGGFGIRYVGNSSENRWVEPTSPKSTKGLSYEI